MPARAKLCIIAICAIVLAGCARQQPPPVAQPRPTVPVPPQPPAPSAAGAAAYVAAASSLDLFEIRSSELALERSSSLRIREFAAMMISAHKGTSAQLSFAGRRLNLLPSAKLSARHAAMLDALQTAADFDARYRQLQAAAHQEALKLHSDYAARGTSPTLRPVAAAARPIIERHVRLLGYL